MEKDKHAVVSVIVPVYNTAPYVEKCIQSIVSQTYENIEVILVDDGSADGSDRICQKFSHAEERIKYIWQENKGVVRARKTGIDQASGEYMLFIDSDDWIEPDMVECLMGYIREADMVTSGVYYEVQNGVVSEYTDKYPEGIYNNEDMETVLRTMIFDTQTNDLQRLTPWICNKLYRISIVRDIYNELDAGMKFAEDAVFFYKYFLRCQSFTIVHKCCYHYRYRGESASHGTNPNILSDINMAYLSLMQDFKAHRAGESLVKQLQHWIVIMVLMALNGQMGFKEIVHIPEFLLDTDGLRGKKIVLYGAGKMGKDYKEQLCKMGYQIVLWVDSHVQEDRGIKAPIEILRTDYDITLIAVSRYEYAKDIIAILQNMGIGKDRIIWKQPIRVN